MAKKPIDDKFQAEDYLKADQHEKDMAGLTKRIEVLEDKFGQNEKFAVTFCEAITTQSKIKDTITEHIVKQVKENHQVQQEIADQVNKSDRKAVMIFLKRVGFGGWTIIISLISGAIVYFLKK